MDTNRVLKALIKRYGVRHQSVVAIEELSELQKELTKFYRGKGNKKNLVDELADVQIMLHQVILMHDVDYNDFMERFNEKIDSLSRLLLS